MLLVADLGNSGVKVAAFDGGRIVAAARLGAAEVASPEALAGTLGIPAEEFTEIAAVSVSEGRLVAFLAGAGRGARVLGVDLPLLIENRYEIPGDVGRDRLVNAAAGHARSGGAALVVDLGSAVTVDAVSADGAFLGGAIAPGLHALRRGLAAAAPALPDWDLGEPAGAVPGSTAEAIRAGIVLGFAGLVDRLIVEGRRWLDRPDAPVLLTGGDAPSVATRLCAETEVVPHLTLEGVRLLYDRARRADAPDLAG